MEAGELAVGCRPVGQETELEGDVFTRFDGLRRRGTTVRVCLRLWRRGSRLTLALAMNM